MSWSRFRGARMAALIAPVWARSRHGLAKPRRAAGGMGVRSWLRNALTGVESQGLEW